MSGKSIKSIDDAIDWLDTFLEEMDEFYGLAALRYGDEASKAMEFIHYYRMKELEKEWDKEDGIEDYIDPYLKVIDYPSCCDGCSNNPKNGGSGICNCALPYMKNPTTYTVPYGDSVMVNSTGGYVYTTSTKLPDASTPTINIAEAVDRTKKYIKE